ncbi:MAG: universal stress protein [Solirubrobacteraceae bacterium]
MTVDTPTRQPEPSERIPRSREPLTDQLLAETSRPGYAAAVGVIVAFDGSPAADDALVLSERLARSPGAKLLVACAFPFESLAGIPFEPRAARIANGDHRIFVRQDADAVLAEARATLPDDLDVTFRALGCESVAQGLRQLALSETADMLVLGSTRRGRLRRVLHPSLARRVLRDPPCAVTLVSHDPRDRSESVPRDPESSAGGLRSVRGTLTRYIRDLRRGGS